jgi:proline dehydrogenase
MPGERVEDALLAARELAGHRITTMLTRLGEHLTTVAESDEVAQHYLDVMDQIAAAGLDAHPSIKPTQLGLDLDRGTCERNLQRLVQGVEQRGSFLWIDMEGSAYVGRTLELYRHARARSPRIGVAVQAYLFRTAADVETLVPLGAAIRVVKGAYLEPPTVAFARKADTDENFFRLCTRLLSEDAQRAGVLLQIGTHDVRLIRRLSAWIADHDVPPVGYEFAMLYGIRPRQQLRLASEGRRLRVLISYGEHWFPWYLRRLAERPANVWFVLRNVGGR